MNADKKVESEKRESGNGKRASQRAGMASAFKEIERLTTDKHG